MSRFVRPDTTTLTLANGDTLTVRTRLTYGERQDAYARIYVADAEGGTLQVHPSKLSLALVCAYLVDWSFRDDQDHLVAIRMQPPEVLEAALNALDVESFYEVKEAIQAHETRMLGERTAQKKMTAGAPASSATSASAG